MTNIDEIDTSSHEIIVWFSHVYSDFVIRPATNKTVRFKDLVYDAIDAFGYPLAGIFVSEPAALEHGAIQSVKCEGKPNMFIEARAF